MSKCEFSDNDMHTFTFSRVDQDIEPILQTYVTCITCGERRAIGVMGDLLVRKDREWVKMEPENE